MWIQKESGNFIDHGPRTRHLTILNLSMFDFFFRDFDGIPEGRTAPPSAVPARQACVAVVGQACVLGAAGFCASFRKTSRNTQFLLMQMQNQQREAKLQAHL